MLAACFVAPWAGGRAALLTAALAAAYLSWSNVTQTAPVEDLSGTCHDRQGAHAC